MKKPTVCIGLSGGVDSSVAAYLLKKEGYDVFGLFMKNWDETTEDGVCPAEKDFEDVLKVAAHLDIPCYSVNFTQEYQDRVFKYFLEELKEGRTPNPDILCNREIKFDVFFEKARSLGAAYVATGHYAHTKDGLLLKAKDEGKDQTYFLHAVKRNVFKNVLFPLGTYTKKAVRALAEEIGLPTSKKKDSTGICFIGKRNFRDFVHEYLPYQSGPMCLVDGEKIGEHVGVAFYTIGQRKGLGIGGPGDAYFVVDKDVQRNTLYVAQGENHPSLFARALLADQATWIHEAPTLPFSCTAKIRYRQEEQPCVITEENGMLLVTFQTKQRAITPAQSVVFYSGDKCLGGAVIRSSIHSYKEFSFAGICDKPTVG